jgi:2-C-methyl-D-erythritol 4-phosphate cytidylyltransferase
MNSRIWAVLPAAGVGARMQADRPKQYLELLGRTVLEHTIETLLSASAIEQVVVAISAEDPYWGDLPVAGNTKLSVCEGGQERCHSVLNGLNALQTLGADEQDWVMVHDAARPCLRAEDLSRLIHSVTIKNQGGILAVPVRDTMKLSDDSGEQIDATVDRSHMWHALTPQMFRVGELRSAIEQALEDGFVVTDEASAMEHAGQSPLLVRGHADNIKITIPEDLALAEFYLQRNAS